MKKQLKSLGGRLRRNKGAAPKAVPRITNDTLAEHREAVIAKGKRYKYPMQQTKHRTVAVSVVIVVLLVASLAVLTWFRLYKAQDTSSFFYRVTQILPLSVATIDGEQVPYKDYLLELRSSMHYLTTKEAVNFASDDGKRQLEYQKRQALDKVVEQTLIRKLAKENNITVSQGEVDDFIKNQINANQLGASEDDYKAVIKDYYDWTFDEYQHSIENQLLRRKVVFAIDAVAKGKADQIYQQLQSGADFAKLASDQSDDIATKAGGGDVGFLAPNSEDPDNIYKAVKDLQIGQVSVVSKGANNFYVARLIERRGNEVHAAHITVSLKAFSDKLKTLRDEGKVKEFITVDKQ